MPENTAPESAEPAAASAPEPDRLTAELIRSAALFTRTAGRIAGGGYSSIAWRVLADLDRDGAARAAELAALQRVAQPSMTSLVHRLEGEGWIARNPDPADGRAALAGITLAGIRALAEFRAAAAARFAATLAEFSDADRAALGRAAELLTRLARDSEDPRPPR